MDRRLHLTPDPWREPVLLRQHQRQFYQRGAMVLTDAVAEVAGAEIDLRIEFPKGQSPLATADKTLALPLDRDAICLAAALPPVDTDADECFPAI